MAGLPVDAQADKHVAQREAKEVGEPRRLVEGTREQGDDRREDEPARPEHLTVERLPMQPLAGEREHAADRDGVGHGLEADADRATGGRDERPQAEPNQRGGGHEGHGDPETSPSPENEEHGRPQQIELLLDRERPRVANVPRSAGVIVGGIRERVDQIAGRERDPARGVEDDEYENEGVVRRKDAERPPEIEA